MRRLINMKGSILKAAGYRTGNSPVSRSAVRATGIRTFPDPLGLGLLVEIKIYIHDSGEEINENIMQQPH